MEAKDSQAIASNAADKVARVGKVDKVNKVNKVDRDGKVDSVNNDLKVSNDNHTRHPKHGWEVKKLGEVGTIITGATPSTKEKDNYSSKDYCFVKPSDISNHSISSINETEDYISEKAYLKSRQLPKDAVLTTCIGIIGKVGILKVEAICNQQINAIIPNNNIISKFLAYSIFYRKKYLQHIANAPVVPIINKKGFSEIPIAIPPMEEQERIVAELDCLSGVIEKKRQQLKEYDALAQSIFYDMFGDPISNEKGWKVKRLIDVVKMQRGFDLPVQERDNSGTIPIFGSNGIIGCHSSHKAEYGIITGRSGTLGEVYSCDKPFWPLNTTLFSVDTHGNNIIFLKYLMANFHLERFKAGAGVPTLNRNEFHNELIPNISLSLQQEFAEKIEAIEKQKELLKRSIKEIETLFDARMDYYFGDT